MNTTMQQGLASLLIRRTETGRAKALLRIEAWQKAIETVQQAGQMAEYIINVPSETIQDAQEAAVQIHTANYILAVHLDNKVVTQRMTLIAIATGALQERIEECQRTKETAKQEILRAEIIAKEEVQVVHQEIREAQLVHYNAIHSLLVFWGIPPSEILQYNETHCFTIPPSPLTPLRFFYSYFGKRYAYLHENGMMIAILSVILYLILVKDYTFTSFITFVFLAYLAPTVLLVIRSLKYTAEQCSIVMPASATLQEKVEAAQQKAKAAEEKLRQVTEASNKQLGEVKSMCENNMRRAEVHRKKAENALQWLKAEFVQHD